MSARIPGEPNTFLINNYGEMFDEITASCLVKMDMDGNVLGDGGKFNNAGFTIHSGVYKARPDAMCVMHTHTRAGAGVSLLRERPAPDQPGRAAGVRRCRLSRIRRAGLARRSARRSAAPCQHGSCVVLLNHGLLTLGPTIHGAFMRLYMLERACELELIARPLDEPPVPIDEYVIGKAAERMRKRRADHRRLRNDGISGRGAHGRAQGRRLPRAEPPRQGLPTGPATGQSSEPEIAGVRPPLPLAGEVTHQGDSPDCPREPLIRFCSTRLRNMI